MGVSSTAGDVSSAIAVPNGIVHGGPNPVVGATVTLYSTVTNAGSTYGSAGTVLATAVSRGDGSFTFTSRQPCPSTGVNEQAYITSTGGNPGGPPGTTNPNYVLMAALGNCSDLSTDTRIWVDEPSTIAAAYALSGFLSTTTTGGSIVVNVGAPKNAAAAVGSCVNTGNTVNGVTTATVTSCVTAGLRHAFQNAANLVSAVGTSAAPPNGQAYASAPSAAGSVAPQAVIHSLANSLQSCVNSSGGTSGNNNACGRLFQDTTPVSGTAPTNTLDALVNLAKNPTLGAADIFTLATPQVFYSPSLTTAPTDFTLAIVYPASSTGLPALSAPYVGGFADGLVLDSNDNVYLAFEVQPSSGAGATLNSVAALSSNGTLLYGATAPTIPNERAPFSMATDNLGNVWTTLYTTSSNTADFRVFQYSAATGANVQTYSGFPVAPSRLAIDRQNNVWFTVRGGSTSNYQNIQELVQSNSYTRATFAPPPIGQGSGAVGIAIDAGQNIWATALTYQEVFPNTGSSSSPAYGGALIQAGSFSGYLPYSAIDSAGNLWAGTGSGVVEFTPTLSAGKVTGIAQTATLPPSDFELGIAADGGGAVWVSDLGAGSLARYTASSATGLALNPCLVAAGSTTCGAGFSPNQLAVDSAGSMWVTTGSGVYAQPSSGLLQVIGSATPVWPQLSYGHPGQEPQ